MNTQFAYSFYFFIFIAVVIFFYFSVTIVHNQTVKIIERMGKYNRTLKSGLNFIIPFVEWVAGNVSLRVQQLAIEAETKTKDNVFVHIRVAVQYLIEEHRAFDAFYKLTNARMQMESYVYDVIRSSLPKMLLDEAFENKDAIAQDIKNELSEEMQSYGYQIIRSLVIDIDPEENVKHSMNEINAAQRQLEATKAKAEADKLIRVKEAEGERESMRLLGEGIALQRKAIASGFKQSIEDIKLATDNVLEAEKVSSLVMMYQYLDTLETMTKNGKSNIILMPNSPSGFQSMSDEMIKALLVTKGGT